MEFLPRVRRLNRDHTLFQLVIGRWVTGEQNPNGVSIEWIIFLESLNIRKAVAELHNAADSIWVRRIIAISHNPAILMDVGGIMRRIRIVGRQIVFECDILQVKLSELLSDCVTICSRESSAASRSLAA